MDYLYDGSFEGLLTAVYHDYHSGRVEGIYQETAAYQGNLFQDETRIITTEKELADRVYRAIEAKLSASALSNIYQTYLSNEPEKENLILRYLRFSFATGSRADSYHTHPSVRPLQQAAARVGMEKHRMLGLLRFAAAEHFLYASFAPDHNIISLLADHFADRMRAEHFIIHDVRRQLAVIHECGKPWHLQILDDPSADSHSQCLRTQWDDLVENPEEIWYQRLWSKYFSSVAIETRQNARLQSHFIPQRYRAHLTEILRQEKDSQLNNIY